MIFILNTDEEIIGHLSNDHERACPYIDDLFKEDLETGAHTFEFSVPADHPDASLIKEEGFIAIRDFSNRYLQFSIATIEDEHTAEGLYKRVYSEFAWSELNGHIVRPFTLPAADLQTAVTHVLTGTRWQPGTIEFFGNAEIEMNDYPTALAALHELKDVFEAEIRFRVEIENNKIAGRFVDFVKRRGENNGKVVSFGKDLTSAKRIYDRTNIATALIGLGKGESNGRRMTFTTTVWSQANGDPVDKPSGQDWVGDDDARKRWGIDGQHILKVFEYDTTNPGVLLQKTWEELQRLKNAVYTYEAEAEFLDQIGWDWEQTEIGDDVLIQDHLFDPPLTLNARVRNLERSKTNPKLNKITFGDYQPAISKAVDVAALQSQLISQPSQLESEGFEVIRSEVMPSETDGILWVQPATGTRPFDMVYTYNESTETWDAAAPTHAADIGAETPTGAASKAVQEAFDAQFKAMRTGFYNTYQDTLSLLDEILLSPAYYTTDTINTVTAAKDNLVTTYSIVDRYIQQAIDANPVTTSDLDRLELGQEIFDDAILQANNAIQQASEDAGGLRVGTITGITLQVANAGITNEGIYDTSIRMWAGESFTNRDSAPFRVQQNGEVFASNIKITGGAITGGEINVTREVTIGNALYLGRAGMITKYIYFNGGEAAISSGGPSLNLGAEDYINLQTAYTQIYNSGSVIYVTGSKIEANTELEVYDTARMFGDFTITDNLTGNYMRLLQSVGQWQTNAQETGFCGIGGFMTGGSTAEFIGVAVNFRVGKTFAPASVAISGVSSNLTSSTQVRTTGITSHGFWLYLVQSTGLTSYRYWRGTYTA